MTSQESATEEVDQFGFPLQPQRMPIKKVFMILGFAFSLSLILLNAFQFAAVPLIEKYLPKIYSSDYFMFGISTIPLMLIAMPVVFAVTSVIPTIKTYYKSKISFGKFLMIITISYIGMMIVNIVSLIVTSLITQLTGLSAVNPMETIALTGGIMPMFVFGVIISPIVEEIMFRYVIISKLRGYGSGVAIFASSFIFGLYHGNLFQMFYAIAVGAVLAAIYYKTGKLIYSIILHIAVNFIGSVLPMGMLSKSPYFAAISGFALIAIAVTGFVFGIITLCKTNFTRLKNDIIPSYYLKSFFSNAGILVYILLIAAIVSLQFI